MDDKQQSSEKQPISCATQRSAPHEVRQEDNKVIEKRGRGRPTLYTPDRARAFIDEYRASGDSVDTIARRHGTVERTIYQWIGDNPEFSQMFAQARATRATALVEKAGKRYEALAEEAETASNEDLRKIDLKGRLAHMHGKHAEWLAERMNPRQYAPQQHVDVTQRALNVHLHADTPEDVQDMANRLEGLR